MLTRDDILQLKVGDLVQDTDDVIWTKDYKCLGLKPDPTWNEPVTVATTTVLGTDLRPTIAAIVDNRGEHRLLTEGCHYYRLLEGICAKCGGYIEKGDEHLSLPPGSLRKCAVLANLTKYEERK